MTDAPNSTLLELLAPVLARIAALDPAKRDSVEAVADLEVTLEREFPHDGNQAGAIGREIARGIAEGWLCDRGEPSARFSRLAKPGPATHGLSIDVVSMLGSGLEHTHTKGEVTLGFPARGPGDSCQFENRPPGWVFLGPGSRHIPRVDGERMNLIYFLPDGAVQWHG